MVGEDAQSRDPQITQNLAANTEFATIHRLRTNTDSFGTREIWRIHIVLRSTNLLKPREEVFTASFRPQVDNRAATFALNCAHRGAEIVATRRCTFAARDAKDVAEKIASMHTNEDRLVDFRDATVCVRNTDATERQYEMRDRIDRAFVGEERELSLRRRNART
jgi:hypothetical protein